MMARLRQPNSSPESQTARRAWMSSSLSGWITFCSTFTFEIPVKGLPAHPPIRVHQEKKARVSRKRRCRVPRETPLSEMTLRNA